MTSWGLIYRALRGTFPNANYHQGTSLIGFSQRESGVAATFEGAGELTADILVGADGSRSLVRQKLMPDVTPLKEWEADQLALGRDLERSGRALGNRSQFPQSKKPVL